MPAHPKYLSSRFQRFLKISAGIVGGYLVSMSFHLALASWFNQINVIITSTFTGFLLWMICFLLAFIGKNGWKVWILYLTLTIVFSSVIYLVKYQSLPLNG